MFLKRLKDVVQGKTGWTSNRSAKWSSIRKKFLKSNNKCAVCGGTKKLEVHHKKPFHLHPELELVESNLIALCESKNNGVTCHLLFGHLGNYRSINENVEKDVRLWNSKLSNRPKLTK